MKTSTSHKVITQFSFLLNLTVMLLVMILPHAMMYGLVPSMYLITPHKVSAIYTSSQRCRNHFESGGCISQFLSTFLKLQEVGGVL